MLRKFVLSLLFVYFMLPQPFSISAETDQVQVVAPVTDKAQTPDEPQTLDELKPPAEEPALPAEQQSRKTFEFVAGELTAIDQEAHSITVLVYALSEADDHTLQIKIDPTTQITNADTKLDFESLRVGDEIDTEYDPKTLLASYLFIY